MDSARRELAGLWPQVGLLIETPRLQLRLPRRDEILDWAHARLDTSTTAPRTRLTPR